MKSNENLSNAKPPTLSEKIRAQHDFNINTTIGINYCTLIDSTNQTSLRPECEELLHKKCVLDVLDNKNRHNMLLDSCQHYYKYFYNACKYHNGNKEIPDIFRDKCNKVYDELTKKYDFDIKTQNGFLCENNPVCEWQNTLFNDSGPCSCQMQDDNVISKTLNLDKKNVKAVAKMMKRAKIALDPTCTDTCVGLTTKLSNIQGVPVFLKGGEGKCKQDICFAFVKTKLGDLSITGSDNQVNLDNITLTCNRDTGEGTWNTTPRSGGGSGGASWVKIHKTLLITLGSIFGGLCLLIIVFFYFKNRK